ncbi:TNF receptor-associated factor 6-like [Antedon mediterranea]|uniref:TNF receptor-associated factor 6-like n=1 Tax=Antedon mediterranea TaxID=105859 RepID=UPI003AF4A0B3
MASQPAASSTSHTTPPSLDNDYGYGDVNFDPIPDRKYHCPICLSVMKNPVQTKCGHRFCQACILRISRLDERTRNYTKCPVDNTWFYINIDLFDDVAIKREILGLKCVCNNQPNGCQWKGELLYLEEHKNTCDFSIIPCPNGCDQQCLRRERSTHLTNCPLRTVQCSQCCDDVVAKDLTRHQLLHCPKLPVSCFLCGRNDILREEIPKHMRVDGTCPNTLVPCNYSVLGCNAKFRRCDKEEHMQRNTSQHLALMSDKLLIQTSIIQKQSNEIEELTRTQASFRELIEGKVLEGISEQISQIENRIKPLEKFMLKLPTEDQ